MQTPYYIVPTSERSFELRYVIDNMDFQVERSTEYVIVEVDGTTLIAEREKEAKLLEDAKELSKMKLLKKYKKVSFRDAMSMKKILEDGFATKDSVFEAIFKDEMESYIKKARTHLTNLPITEEDNEKAKAYLSKEAQEAKKAVLAKARALVDGSAAIGEDSREEAYKKIESAISETPIDFAMTNIKTQPFGSVASKNYILIAHSEDEIRALNNGELDGFWESEEFQIALKGTLFHEIGHKIGDAFGVMFGESFSVKLQGELLKEMGLRLNLDKIVEVAPEWMKKEQEQQEGSQFERLLLRKGIREFSAYEGLRRHYEKLMPEERETTSKRDVARLRGNRDDTHDHPREYADVLFDRELSLQESFDMNIEKNAMNLGREMTVIEALTIEGYIGNGHETMGEKAEVLTKYLFNSGTSDIIMEKMKNRLFEKFNINKDAFEKAQYKAYAKLSMELVFEFAKAAPKNGSEGITEARRLDWEITRRIRRLSHILSKEDSMRMLEAYFDAVKPLIESGAVEESEFSFYMRVSHEKDDNNVKLNDALVQYVREKLESLPMGEMKRRREERRARKDGRPSRAEGERAGRERREAIKKKMDEINSKMTEDESPEIAAAAKELQKKTIIVQGTDPAEQFEMTYSEEEGGFKMKSVANGKPLSFVVNISPKTQCDIAKAAEEHPGEMEKFRFPVTVISSARTNNRDMHIKEVREAAEKQNISAEEKRNPETRTMAGRSGRRP